MPHPDFSSTHLAFPDESDGLEHMRVQIGHNSKNKACPLYSVKEAEARTQLCQTHAWYAAPARVAVLLSARHKEYRT